MQGFKQKISKVVPLCKIGEKLGGVPIQLKASFFLLKVAMFF